jgi:hypothetical protein
VRNRDVLFAVSAASDERDHVIEMKILLRENFLPANVATHPVAPTDPFIVDAANGGSALPSTMTRSAGPLVPSIAFGVAQFPLGLSAPGYRPIDFWILCISSTPDRRLPRSPCLV